MNKRKQMIVSVAAVLLLVLLTVGVTYAVFTYTKLGTTENTVTAGTLKFLYTENTGVGAGIALTDALPVSDTVGKSYSTEGKVFDFSIEATNSGNDAIPYEVTLRKKSTSTLAEDAVKVYLTDMTEDADSEILAPTLYKDLIQTRINVGDEVEKTIHTDNVVGGELTYLKDYRLRMWVAEETDFSSGNYNGKTFIATVNVYANATVSTDTDKTVYVEDLLNGADPVLKSDNTVALTKGINRIESATSDELVPVIIDNTGKVTKANIYEKWYSYGDKEWANAVILKDYSITYEDGAEIPESNIESYFVWIPKYSYQLWDLGNYNSVTSITNKEHVIPVRFGLTNTDDSVEGECTTPGTAGSSGNCQAGDNGDYMTHPAFLSFNSNGFWVGKFETGYDGATSTSAAETNTDKVDTSKIIIKPNVYSWRNITLGKMFKNSYDYQRSLDSHMMKNTEWGAVAYLQHSEYGSQTSVRTNNNNAYITGYASTEEPTEETNNNLTSIEGNRNESTSLGVDGTYTVNYLNSASTVASTTGNYTGIYDMSGGAWDRVIGYTTKTTTDSSGLTSLYSNFFTDSSYAKYWDKYTSTVSTSYNNRILGDATGEMGSLWYGDLASFFVDSTYPWFKRGGHWGNGTHAGVFAFHVSTGGIDSGDVFRVVLTPVK